MSSAENTTLFIKANACTKAQQLKETLELKELPDDLLHDNLFWLDCITPKKTDLNCLAICSLQQGPVFIDFLAGKKAHRRQFGGGMGQPLVRAMGKIDNRLPRIVDATAGMGSDSFVLASLGFDVTLLERSPYVSALLADALQRALETAGLDSQTLAIFQRMHLHNTDSADFIANCPDKIEVVYMDPMYPEKKKKAAAKKEMQLLQHIIGPDMDSERLLNEALKKASYRVVVKRPKGAPVIANQFNIAPTSAVSSPNTRYDIYSIDALKQKLSICNKRQAIKSFNLACLHSRSIIVSINNLDKHPYWK
ncbi:class I SAM-dependent methyltransferase [Thiomicrorhabdus sediminis]|nr:class I SAM-dependent methyltransferase [Thiomicrorhabdus sediminis]